MPPDAYLRGDGNVLRLFLLCLGHGVSKRISPFFFQLFLWTGGSINDNVPQGLSFVYVNPVENMGRSKYGHLRGNLISLSFHANR